MNKYFIKKHSIAYYTIRILQVLFIMIAILSACGEYQGKNYIQANISIKLVVLISIMLLVLIDKIKIK